MCSNTAVAACGGRRVAQTGSSGGSDDPPPSPTAATSQPLLLEVLLLLLLLAPQLRERQVFLRNHWRSVFAVAVGRHLAAGTRRWFVGRVGR